MNNLIDLLFNNEPVLKNRDEYTEIFKLPIEYIDEKHLLDNNIISDLELLNSEEKYSLYNNIFQSKTFFGTTNLNLWCKYYTSNKEYLIDTQNLLKTFKDFTNNNNNTSLITTDSHIDDDTIFELCDEIMHDDGFMERYQYIDLPLFKAFNNNDTVLQLTAIHNLSSPLFSLLVPLVSIILPFFIIKLQGHDITLELYFEHLKKVFGNHVLGQMISNFNESAIDKKIYLLVSLVFYGFQIYNNINSCCTYYGNIKYIHDTLNTIKVYLSNSLVKMDNYLL